MTLCDLAIPFRLAPAPAAKRHSVGSCDVERRIGGQQLDASGSRVLKVQGQTARKMSEVLLVGTCVHGRQHARAKLVINVVRGEVSRPHTRARAMAGPLIASGFIARHNGCSLRRRRREEVGSVCRRVAQSRLACLAKLLSVTCGSEQLRADNMIDPHTTFTATLAHHARTHHACHDVGKQPSRMHRYARPWPHEADSVTQAHPGRHLVSP
jgi:hypothetical protein